MDVAVGRSKCIRDGTSDRGCRSLNVVVIGAPRALGVTIQVGLGLHD